MQAIKVDDAHRIRLAVLNPGDYYEPHFHDADRIELRRMTAPPPRRRLTEAEALQAIRSSAVRFTANWETLRAETREP
jgi:hypothetical protein